MTRNHRAIQTRHKQFTKLELQNLITDTTRRNEFTQDRPLTEFIRDWPAIIVVRDSRVKSLTELRQCQPTTVLFADLPFEE